MEKTFEIRFKDSAYSPVRLKEGARFCESFDEGNSPLLFGCRLGVCGTCLVEISEVSGGELPAPSAEERELLEALAGDHPNARLACQLTACADLTIHPLG